MYEGGDSPATTKYATTENISLRMMGAAQLYSMSDQCT